MQTKTAVYLSLALDPILNLFSIQTRLLSVPLKTLVDSSSGVTWFKSSACHSVSANRACAGNLIDPSALLAAGFKTNGVAFSLTYPFGLDPSVPNAGPETVSGQIWYGPVSIVGSALSPSFSFGLISSDSGNFPYDGVLVRRGANGRASTTMPLRLALWPMLPTTLATTWMRWAMPCPARGLASIWRIQTRIHTHPNSPSMALTATD